MLYKRCDCVDTAKCLHPYHYKFRLKNVLHRGNTDTANSRLAERVVTKRKHDIVENAEKIAKPQQVRLSAHIADYVAYTAEKFKTAYKDADVLARVLACVGDRPLSDVSGFQLQTWMSRRAKDVSKSTVNREFNIVQGCFSRAVEWKRLITSPFADIERYHVDDKRVRWLDDAELKAMLAIENPWVVDLCRLSMITLGRITAMTSIHRRHIGPSWIETLIKGGQVMRVAVTPELRTNLLSRVHPTTGLVFGDEDTGRRLSQQAATKRVKAAFKRAGIVGASHHTMRHTGVTIMLENGVNPRTIQKLAGWSSLRMLERYGHARDAESMRAVRSVANHLDGVQLAKDEKKKEGEK